MSGEQDGIRLRRTQSVTRAEDIKAEQLKVRSSQPDKPCHKPRDSLFSWTSGFDNFTGFVNWAFLLLLIGGLRLFLENLLKYGIRVDPLQWIYVISGRDETGTEYPSIVLLMYSAVPILLCLLTEKGLSLDIIPNTSGMIGHVVNLIVLVLIPMVAIYVKDGFSLIGASAVSSLYCVLFLKLWSYVQVNMWCRMELKRNKNKNTMRRQSYSYSNLSKSGESTRLDDTDHQPHLVQYPNNLTVKDLVYFILAPTLCYELNFPKTSRIRKRFLLKRIIEVILGVQLILAIMQQYMVPSVKNSLIPFSNMDVTKATERLLKLAIPNHLAWLCFFYIVFHSFLNLMGELLHFADRNFYCDWWNANNIATFWRNWNMVVHRWCLRHLYFPLVEMGYGRFTASMVVFFISAFFHEYLVSVPLKTFKIWAFMGMMAQLPLSFLSHYMEKNFGPRIGNVIVWATLIVGQPLCVMMYYHDYVVEHFSETIEDFSHV